MCGRVSQGFTWEELAEKLALAGAPANLKARYNAAPGQLLAAVRLEEDERRLAMLRWGLIPHWAGDPGIARKLINARAETVREKPSFRSAYAARRCALPVDGFYEWRRVGGAREPWRIVRKDRGIFALAGLWERWIVPEGAEFAERGPGEALETFAVVTTRASEDLKPVHDRMPVILADEPLRIWLEGGEVSLAPFEEGALEAYRANPRVSNARNDDPQCAEPLANGSGRAESRQIRMRRNVSEAIQPARMATRMESSP